MAAGRPQNRLELRRQYEAAEPVDPMEDEADDVGDDGGDDDESEKKPKKKAKAKAPAKAKAKAVKAPKPSARMRIVWTVVNDAFKTVGTFEFSQKEAAEARAAELTAKGKGTHFVQKVKEPMPDNAPGLGAALPRPEVVAEVAAPVATKAKGKGKPVAAADDEEIEDEADDDDDADADADSDSEPDDEDD